MMWDTPPPPPLSQMETEGYLTHTHMFFYRQSGYSNSTVVRALCYRTPGCVFDYITWLFLDMFPVESFDGRM